VHHAGLSFDATVAAQSGYDVVGSIDDARFDPEDVLCRLALAMEADGIRFKLELLDAHGVARIKYESDH
jgi:hypothetical protein